MIHEYNNDISCVVGLGNPGKQYENTRHNIGFTITDTFVTNIGINSYHSKFQADYAKGKIDNISLIIVKPMAYMNVSGPPLYQITRYFDINPNRMIIIHDDVDLSFGRIKIKIKGGHGGHNGIRSVIETFGTDEFTRIRVGIGRPLGEIPMPDFVLSRFDSNELPYLNGIVKLSCDAIKAILLNGVSKSMNLFNKKQILSD